LLKVDQWTRRCVRKWKPPCPWSEK